jgi:hypothetical protein
MLAAIFRRIGLVRRLAGAQAVIGRAAALNLRRERVEAFSVATRLILLL